MMLTLARRKVGTPERQLLVADGVHRRGRGVDLKLQVGLAGASTSGFGGVDCRDFGRSRWGVFGGSPAVFRPSARGFGGVDFGDAANLGGVFSGADPAV